MWTLSAVLILIAGFVLLMVFVPNLSKGAFLVIFMCLIIPCWIGAHFDRKARTKRIEQEMHLKDFVLTAESELDSELRSTYLQTKPHNLGTASLTHVFSGLHSGYELVLAEHRVSVGKNTLYYTSCAVWTSVDLPKVIIRQRNLIDKVVAKQDLGDPAFDKQREIESTDLDLARQLLQPLASWFVVDKHSAMSFRLHEVPGKVEMWAMNQNWVVVADRGRANPRQMLDMAEFASSFVRALEHNSASLDVDEQVNIQNGH
jgi:hypothetical protein|tara:strand:- start:535 stop:1311 length:777 start_codon:yes stop_codon:yes gene_type:complete